MLDKAITNRNMALDSLRYICSFLVVACHATYRAEVYFEPFARIAVPIFFMITGYFYSNVVERKAVGSQIRKVFVYILAANVFIFCWRVSTICMKGDSLPLFLKSLLNGNDILKSLIFNVNVLSGHLWYLNALFYALIILGCFNRFIKSRNAYIYTASLLIVLNLVLGNYSYALFGNAFPVYLSRNFLLCALPFIFIGIFFSGVNVNTSSKALIIILLLSAIGLVIENIILLNFDLLRNEEIFLFTPILACVLFALFLKNGQYLSNKVVAFLAVMGKRTSLTIYIVHPIIIWIIDKLINVLKNRVPIIATIYSHTAPLVIFALATVFSLIFDKVINYIKKRVKYNQSVAIKKTNIDRG